MRIEAEPGSTTLKTCRTTPFEGNYTDKYVVADTGRCCSFRLS